MLDNAPVFLKVGDYVQIVDTDDESEDLIGVIDEIFDDDGNSVKSTKFGRDVAVFIPLSRKDQEQHNLLSVNEIGSYVRQELRLNEGLLKVRSENLEWFDPDEL